MGNNEEVACVCCKITLHVYFYYSYAYYYHYLYVAMIGFQHMYQDGDKAILEGPNF